MKNNILIVLLIVIGVLFIQRECSRPTPAEPETIVEYIYDTIIDIDTVNIPVPYEVVTTVWDTIIKYELQDVDTAEILRDYFAVRLYSDTIINNDELRVVLNDSVHQNRLWGERVVEYQNFRPVSAECPECPKPATKVFIGGSILGSPTQFGAGPTVGLLTKRDNLYTLDYDVLNKTYKVSMYWKLKFNL